MNMIESHKEEANKSLKENCENTEWKEMNKTFQDLKVEQRSIKKTQEIYKLGLDKQLSNNSKKHD